MPTNLNALIRYKQIDRELKNPFLKTTIKSLQTSCSEQLAEHRGIYKLISERTIRDDIRVMRSEALGFNAPIIVENGVYFYNDSNYSIFNSPIEKESLLTEILNLLLEEKPNIKSAKIDDVIAALSTMLINKVPAKNMIVRKECIDKGEPEIQNFEISQSISNIDSSSFKEEKFILSKSSEFLNFKLFRKNQKIKKEGYTWEHILELI